MANLTSKKSDAISKLVAICPRAMEILSEVVELQNYLADNLFLTGAANAVIDADCVGDNAHVTAADFNAAMTALAAMTLSPSQRATLRRVSRVPVAFQSSV